MTIDVEIREQEYATGPSSFTIPFKIDLATELVVVHHNSATKARTLLVKDIDYTVNVSLTLITLLVPTNWNPGTFTLTGDADYLQPVIYTVGDPFSPSVTHGALDRLTKLVQQVLGRAVKMDLVTGLIGPRVLTVPFKDTATNLQFVEASVRANKFSRFDALGNVSVIDLQTGWLPNLSSSRDLFVATAGQTAFVTSGGYTPGYVDVFLNGVKLVNVVDFTATTSPNVTLIIGAQAGDSVEIISYSTSVIGVPPPLPSNLAYLSPLDQTFTNNNTFTGSIHLITGGGGIRIESAFPILHFRKTDGGSHGKEWFIGTDSFGNLNFYTAFDSTAPGEAFISVARTGVNVDGVTVEGDFVQLISASIELRGLVTMFAGVSLLTAVSQLISPVTYSTSMTINALLSNQYSISATNGTAFTINAPTTPTTGQRMLIRIHNASGGALGVATWNSIFRLAGAWTQPTNGNYRSIEFVYNGSSPGPGWYEICRTAADGPT